jgi:hypothetical protein
VSVPNRAIITHVYAATVLLCFTQAHAVIACLSKTRNVLVVYDALQQDACNASVAARCRRHDDRTTAIVQRPLFDRQQHTALAPQTTPHTHTTLNDGSTSRACMNQDSMHVERPVCKTPAQTLALIALVPRLLQMHCHLVRRSHTPHTATQPIHGVSFCASMPMPAY